MGAAVLPTKNLGDVEMARVRFIPITRVTDGMVVTTNIFDSKAAAYVNLYTWATQLQKFNLITDASSKGQGELYTLLMLDDCDELREFYEKSIKIMEEREEWALCEIGWNQRC